MSINTVFVIGAGASEEANLPTGSELKSRIAQLLNIRFDFGELKSGDPIIYYALQKFLQAYRGPDMDINSYLQEAWKICDALPLAISIDNFIDAHKDNEKIALCGKLAIVRSILDAEKKSLLRFERSNFDSSIDFSSLGKTWYIPFFQLLTGSCDKKEVEERFKSITLIIFNYDRCIEHFIYHALLIYYKDVISEAEAANLVKSINIYHPYGNVGTLPWVNRNASVEFGAEPHAEQLLELAKKIKTFTEGTDPDSSEISEIRGHMAMATRVVFLGFAFHNLNMQLIVPKPYDNTKYRDIKGYATTFDRSDNDQEVIKAQINKLYKNKIKLTLANKSCSQFFNDFRLSLTF
jgi:hypothetical protein